MSSLTITHLMKSYGDVHSLKGIDLAVDEGEFVVLLGPSGCGKSTTLRLVAGLDYPTAGRIEFGSRVVADADKRTNVPPNKRGVGLVFQSYALWPHLSVVENVAFPLRSAKVARAKARAEALRFLELVGLNGLEDRPSMSLSGGQQQRVALARALVARPELLLLDEPLSNLDATLRTTVRSEIRRVHRETARTTIHVTHDQDEALALADRVVLMNHGLVEQMARPEELFELPATPFAAAFVGFENIFDGVVDADAAGASRVSLPGVGSTLVARTSQRSAIGSPVTVAFRARDARFVPVGEDDVIVGAVVDIVYTGGAYDFDVLAGENHVLVSVAKGTGGLPEVGDTVAIRVHPDRTCSYPRAGLAAKPDNGATPDADNAPGLAATGAR